MGARIRRDRLATAALASWFVTLSAMRLARLSQDAPFSDLRLYLRGSAFWLRGEDPWSAHVGTLQYYGAAPPSLLPFAPFTLLPEPLAIGLIITAAIAASIWTLRRLGLPWWWLAWPPLVDNLWNGNPQVFLVPLLLGPAASLAPVLKAYGIATLVIQLRLRALVLSGVIALVTLPFLPWGIFLERMPATWAFLVNESEGGMSAWFLPVLVPFAAVALIVMGRQRASWWFVPALWPSTQWYYSLMALPALTPITAAILAAPVQGGPAVAAIIAAVEVWYVRRRRPDQPEPVPAQALGQP